MNCCQLLLKRYYSSSQVFADVARYLIYCKLSEVNTNSTVFRGTLYEYYVKNLLETKLHAKYMVRCGGSYDNGIDIIGKWDLLPFYQESLRLSRDGTEQKLYTSSLLHHLPNSSLQKRPPISLSNDVHLVVQCKNTKKRPGAAEVRQLSGVLEYHKFHKKRTVMMMVSPHPLTLQGISQLNKSSYSMVNLVASPLSNASDEYDYEHWKGGDLMSVYLNRTATKVLSGLRMEQQLSQLTKSR
ncbi:RRG7 [Candida theae]|uniref:Required for respiratory growth protein 7, mitochondrial n=1 Tax=Candida theae TaxID=1198502 RepID=A0AAD5BE61_9ASCO|nr:RRG7 [Candida theae]KAI5957842.1 RRG7 [Candida theae]